MGATVQLTPEQEVFARTLVESGRYSDIAEVVHTGLHLLQEQDARRKAFDKMIAEVREETARDGAVTIDEVAAGMDAIINGDV
jgi:putative addiction module antidote protein, CC2985 family